MFLVGIGGTLGALARYQLGRMIARKSHAVFPLGTFIINVSGALLLGFLTGIDVDNKVYLLLGEGFLGAYTTFSTFMYEGFHLFQGNERMNAFAYIGSSLILGIIGYAAGFEAAKIYMA